MAHLLSLSAPCGIGHLHMARPKYLVLLFLHRQHTVHPIRWHLDYSPLLELGCRGAILPVLAMAGEANQWQNEKTTDNRRYHLRSLARLQMGHLLDLRYKHSLPLLLRHTLRLHDDWRYRCHTLFHEEQAILPYPHESHVWACLYAVAVFLPAMGQYGSSADKAAADSTPFSCLHSEPDGQPYYQP